MNTINEVRFVENKVRACNNLMREKGDEYLKQLSIRTKKNTLKLKENPAEYKIEYFSDSSDEVKKRRPVSFEKIFNRRRLQYISALNLGKIKRVSVSKLYEYEIVFNEATQKYEKGGKGNPFKDPVNTLIRENEDLWDYDFTPEKIIDNAIKQYMKKHPETAGLSRKAIFNMTFNPESILLTAIAIKRNTLKKDKIYK